jgi:hypothetical protein
MSNTKKGADVATPTVSKMKRMRRFDYKRANEGSFVHITDKDGNSYHHWKLLLVDRSLPRIQKLAVKLREEAADAPERSFEETIVEALLATSLVDWNGPVNEAGEPLPFSIHEARAFFLDHIVDEETGDKYYENFWIVEQLSVAAEDYAYFQPREQVEDPLKN